MAIAALVLNVVLVAFTWLVLATDGASREVPYIVFAALLLVVPAFSSALLVQRRLHQSERVSEPSPAMRRARQVGVLCNVWLLATACWAIYDQYPHPDEQGFLPYVAVVLLTPVFSIVALLAGSRRSLGLRVLGAR